MGPMPMRHWGWVSRAMGVVWSPRNISHHLEGDVQTNNRAELIAATTCCSFGIAHLHCY